MSGPFESMMSVAREFRRVPLLRDAYEKTDVHRRARRLARAGVIDLDLYALQLGVDEISVEDAADHYVRWGHWAGLLLNPLLDDKMLRAALPHTGRPIAYDYVWTRAWQVPVSPMWNAQQYVADHPDAGGHVGGPVGHLMERVASDPETPVRIEDPNGVRDVAWERFAREQREMLTAWARSDAMRRDRRLSRHFDGVESLGTWPAGEEQPLVSIVLATWNRSGQLRDSVESVLAQSWANWELLIVDDGSWDDTPAIATLLSERDARVVYIPRPHAGVSAARNAGIDRARGAYVTFLDSDNEWEPRFLENMVIGMTEHDASAAFATLEVDNGDHRLFRSAKATLENLTLGNVIDLNTLVVRADTLARVGGFDVGLPRAVDYDLILRIASVVPIEHIPVLGAVYENDVSGAERISTSQPLGWNTFVRIRHAIDWDRLAQRERRSGRTYVVTIAGEDPWLGEKLDAVRRLVESGDASVEIVMIAPTPSDWLRASSCEAQSTSVRAHLFALDDPYAYVVAEMLSVADRDVFVMVEPNVRFTADDLRALGAAVAAGDHTIAAPLIVHDDGTLVTAGAGFPRSAAAPVDLLSRHPIEDAVALGASVEVPAVSGQTFAVATSDLIDVHGVDPLLYNEYELPGLCLALRDRRADYGARTLTDVRLRRVHRPQSFPRIDSAGSLARIRQLTADIPASDFDELYGPLDLSVRHFRAVTAHTVHAEANPDAAPRPPQRQVLPASHHLHPVVVRRRRHVIVDGTPVPRLRWALRVAAPAWPSGGTWGDTHFARSLAKGLESLGQEVVVDHHEIGIRPTAYLDDVTLVLRGLDRVEPTTGGISMLWVISHPDLVTKSEAARFDRVFAASASWAERGRERWDVPIQPLLQCTDPDLFAPSDAPRGSDVLFVGKSRGVARPAVVHPHRAGIPLRVIGGEWEGILPPGAVEAEYIDNMHLGALYGSAGVVLNDHWNDMRREGFVSNRLFDVVAAGGRVLSDSVDGISDIFGDAVATFDSPTDLVEMLQGDLDDIFPSEEDLRVIADRIRNEHSFRARAKQLLEAAMEELATRSRWAEPE